MRPEFRRKLQQRASKLATQQEKFKQRYLKRVMKCNGPAKDHYVQVWKLGLGLLIGCNILKNLNNKTFPIQDYFVKSVAKAFLFSVRACKMGNFTNLKKKKKKKCAKVRGFLARSFSVGDLNSIKKR